MSMQVSLRFCETHLQNVVAVLGEIQTSCFNSAQKLCKVFHAAFKH